MARYFRVVNLDQHQHYRDRSPPWIKLHAAILENYKFGALDDPAKAHVMQIWLLASRLENRVPYDPEWVGRRINATEPVDLDQLLELDYIEMDDGTTVEAEKWPSRYISAALRSEVLRRDSNACVACGAKEPLEIDHIVPVSKGGKSEIDNLQVLCRSCNRKKRVRSKSLRRPAQQRSLETEGETERETDSGVSASPPARPKRDGESKSAKVWAAYSQAYEGRYGAMPIRNAKVNGQLCRVVDRLGGEAPDVAAFYVGHNGRWYVEKGHSVDGLLNDCEKLRTEWATGRTVTNTRARQVDRTASNFAAADEAVRIRERMAESADSLLEIPAFLNRRKAHAG